MKVEYLIDQLKKYNPEDEIVVAYWDRAWYADQMNDYPNLDMTDEQWSDICDDGNDVIDNMDIGAYLYEAARVILDTETTNDTE